MAAAGGRRTAGMGPDCDPLDRKCTYQHPKGTLRLGGTARRKWLRIVDREDIDPAARNRALRGVRRIMMSRSCMLPSRPFEIASSGYDNDMFLRAKYPDRIRVAVIQQNLPEDVDCSRKVLRRR